MKLQWDKTGERFYETGVDHGVLYPIQPSGAYTKGVAWSGLTGVTDKPSGAEANPKYADNIKYLNLISAEDLGGTIKAFYYPPEWKQCDGRAEIVKGITIGQQNRKMFGLCYRTKLGNDTDGQDHGYTLHLIYGAQAAPSERDYQTVNESPDAIEFSWEYTTTPVDVPGFKPTAGVEIKSTDVAPAILAAIEEILYGSETADPRLPLPEELISLIDSMTVKVTVEPESASSTLLGKKVSDLQSNIVVGDDSISGSLKHVTGYTGFSSKAAEQEGHYLALKFTTDPADAVTTVELVGGTKGPVALDADRNIVLLIKSNTQSVKVVSTKNDISTIQTYSLTGLTLEA